VVEHWVAWFAAVTLTVFGIAVVALAAGPDVPTRRAVLARVRATLPARFRS